MPLHQITISGTEAIVGNGFIDPKTTKNYIEAKTYSSTLTTFTLLAGDVFMIGDVVYDLEGTPSNVAVVAAINEDTKIHHVVASNTVGTTALILQAELGWTHIKPSITEVTPGILARMGMVSPTVDIAEMPTDVSVNEIKLKGNLRWDIIKEKLSKNVNVSIESISIDSGEIGVVPDAVTFTVNAPSDFYYYDEDGEIFYGQSGIVKAIVDGLQSRTVRRRAVYDPSYASETLPADSQGKVIGPYVKDIPVLPCFVTEADAIDAITV